MKKSRLVVEYDFDFDLFGISSPAKDYKLAWLANKALKIHMVKVEDLVIEYNNLDRITSSQFLHETEYVIIRLIRNKSYGEDKKPLLVPELPNIDYFLMVQDPGGLFAIGEIMDKLKNLDLIQYIQLLETDKLKSKENLIF